MISLVCQGGFLDDTERIEEEKKMKTIKNENWRNFALYVKNSAFCAHTFCTCAKYILCVGP